MSGPAQPVPGPPAVEVAGLTIRYGDRTAVHDLHLQARAGEVLALLGRNGAGKTSTIETLEGFLRPSAGAVRVLSHDPTTDRRWLAERVGVMPQDGGIAPAARPEEIAHLYAAYYPHPLDPDALLSRLGLDDVRRTPWRRLSGGERQRLSMALALVGRPEVLFLDEPTAGVDVQGRQVIREVVAEQADAGTCVLLATHELDEAERVAHRIAVLDAGRLVAEGTLAELTAGTDAVVWQSPADLDTEALSEHLGLPVATTAPGQFRIEGTAAPVLLARLTGWLAERDVTAHGLRSGPGTLEDAFVALTGHHPEGPEDPEPGEAR